MYPKSRTKEFRSRCQSKKSEYCTKHFKFWHCCSSSCQGDSCNMAQLPALKKLLSLRPGCSNSTQEVNEAVCGFSQLCLLMGGVRHMGLAEFPLLSPLAIPREILLVWCNSIIWTQWHTWPHSRSLGEGRSQLLFPYKPFCFLALMGGALWTLCIKSTQVEDSKKDSTSVPVKGHSLGTRTEDYKSLLAYVEKCV